MGYASQAGRARTSSRSPMAHAICDRCGFRYNFVDLRWQFDWRGASLQNLRILVCRPCYDTPQTQLRSIVLPADPQPIINARPEFFVSDEVDYMTLTPVTIDPITGLPVPNTTTMAEVNGTTTMTKVPVGAPLGYDIEAQMPLVKNIKWAQAVPYLSIMGNGTPVVAVTCSSPHGLSTNSQIGVEGLSQANANGMYSVTVTSATAFKYQANTNVLAGSLLTGKERMVTANMGLPYNYSQIPQTGT
jgi:hypothetical protein